MGSHIELHQNHRRHRGSDVVRRQRIHRRHRGRDVVPGAQIEGVRIEGRDQMASYCTLEVRREEAAEVHVEDEAPGGSGAA